MEIVWDGVAHPEYDELVRKEIGALLADGLACTDDLITHLIEIGDIEDGPLIDAHGRGGKVHVIYIEKPKWVTLSQAQT